MKKKANRGQKKVKIKHVAILLVEGETDYEFYKLISELKFQHIPKKIINLKGNFNINKKIIDKVVRYNQNHPNDTFDVYICIDQEKNGVPPFDRDFVQEELEKIDSFKKLYPIIAVLMIESLFFIDIDGIYKHLKARRTLRNKNKFRNFRKLTHRDLSVLFQKFGRHYYKGIRCQGLVKNLDIDLISSKANEILTLINTVQK
jgi:hypothetical protein